MKRLILGMVSASLLFTTPALAKHHQGGQNKSGAEFTAQHSAQMNARIAHNKMFQERGLDLMKMGNEMIRKGKAKKDGKLMIAGARMLKMGHHMHEESMHTLQDIAHSMKHHLMHAKIGELEMSDAEMDELKKDMDKLQAELQAYKNTCHAEVAKMPESLTLLVDTGNEIIMEASKNGDADKAQIGIELMSMGMKMMGEHGKKHGSKKGHKTVTVEKEIVITD